MFTTMQIIAFVLSSINTHQIKDTDKQTVKIEMAKSKPALYKKIPTKWTKTLEK